MRYQCSAVALRTELPKQRIKISEPKKKSDIFRYQYAVQVVRIELVLGSAVALRTELLNEKMKKIEGKKHRDSPLKIVTKLHISQEKVRAHV